MTYLETAAQFYSQVAETPEIGLCCVQSTPLQLPGLKIPLVPQGGSQKSKVKSQN
jgi:hypothetical protein